MTLLAKLSPYTTQIKLAAYAVAVVSLVAAGWTANGWRLGQQIAQLETAVERKEVARQTALTERQQKAMADALDSVTRSQAALAEERKANTRRVAAAVQKAPTAPQYDCRNLPLPEDYLEDFRQ